MRRLLIIIALCVGCITAADAQSTFTQRLQQSNKGEGKVTVTQSKDIEALVNGTAGTTTPTVPPTPKQQTDKKNEPVTTQKDADTKPIRLTSQEPETPVTAPDTADVRKVMHGYKVSGYRVQVFAGGNSRNDRIKAERTGSEIKGLFPGVPVYVHFYSPRWICRMGNYRTYEEASEVLRAVKSYGYQSAIIVKGKITVQYP